MGVQAKAGEIVHLQFSSGRGPAECRMAVAGIARRCLEEAARAGLTGVEAERVRGEHGPLSVVVTLGGAGAETFAAAWTGTLLWQCPSPLRGKDSRKRWFIACARVALPGEPPPAINPADLTWSTMRSSGPGGQHVNKTESAVRLDHRPTGISVTSSEERSQHRNRAVALAKLAAILTGQAQAEEAQGRERKWAVHDALERGRPVRIFHGLEFR